MQLGDQFRQSVQGAAAAEEELPQDGWFVGVNGVPLGPIPIGDLRELGLAGHIDGRSLVWRDGQGEWKPLGKFPYLVRLLGDAAAGPGAPLEPSPPPPPPAAVNGAAAQPLARGDGERPSAWGDLDEEDDSEVDEQPTTVKGRVSVAPPPAAPPAPIAQPATLSNPMGLAPLASAAGNVAAPNPMRITGMQPAVAAGNAYSLGQTAGLDAMIPVSSVATPEPLLEPGDASLLPKRDRSRLYPWFAVAAAFVLGVILTSVWGSSDADEARKPVAVEPARSLATPVAEKEPAPAEATNEADPATDDAPIGGDAPAAAPVTRPARGTPQGAPTLEIPQAPKANPLLQGLTGPNTPGPSAGVRSSEGRGGGLDQTTIQRTVRRYNPALRQNCWQRALNTRAPGTPTSAKVTALIAVEASGKVQSVTVSGAPRGYPGLAKCIEGAVKGWNFPRAGESTTTSVPFVFVGQ